MKNVFLTSEAHIIRSFLQNPNSGNLEKFFLLCYRKSITYLKKLKSSRRNLPINEYNESKSLSDLAIDILGSFLQSKTDKPYFIIFDYFKKHGITDYENSEERIEKQFKYLLWGFIKKELFRITNAGHPQIANLKRNIKYALNNDEYKIIESAHQNCQIVFFSKNKEKLNADKQEISSDELHSLVHRTFMDSNNCTEWCKKIFDTLDNYTEFSKFIKYHELIKAAITVKSEFIELDNNYTGRLPDPKQQFIRSLSLKAKASTMQWIKDDLLISLLDENKITGADLEIFFRASDEYMTDFSNDGQTDSIPNYFRECTPEEFHSRYIKEYKHNFESVINAARERFKEKMKNNLIKSSYGDYFVIE